MKKSLFAIMMVIGLQVKAQLITTIAGADTIPGYSGDGSLAVHAKLNNPQCIVTDASGNLYIADAGNNVIRMISATTGIITTIAGIDSSGYSGDGGPAKSAKLSYPEGIALDTSGNLYIADTQNSVIRKVNHLTGII